MNPCKQLWSDGPEILLARVAGILATVAALLALAVIC